MSLPRPARRVIEIKPVIDPDAKVYPRSIQGVFQRWRWGFVWLTQLVFYGLCWLPWNGRQAILFDLEARRAYLFDLVLWPQDAIYLALLLILCALALFLFTTVAGRLWCGYTCPQTVYTELFLWIEKLVEGDRPRRIKLDAAPWSPRKLRVKATKHALWLMVGLWTGISFVGYFTPIRELTQNLATLSLGPWESFWVLFYGFATYGNAGFLREQMCIYICPYAQFQFVMFDRDTLLIAYDKERGLIRYATENAVQERLPRSDIIRRALRPRVLTYLLIFLTATSATAWSLLTRPPLKVDIIRDRTTLSREAADGSIENVFRLRVINASEQAHTYTVRADGLPTLSFAQPPQISVGPAATGDATLILKVDPGAVRTGTHQIRLTVTDAADPGIARSEATKFFVP